MLACGQSRWGLKQSGNLTPNTSPKSSPRRLHLVVACGQCQCWQQLCSCALDMLFLHHARRRPRPRPADCLREQQKTKQLCALLRKTNKLEEAA